MHQLLVRLGVQEQQLVSKNVSIFSQAKAAFELTLYRLAAAYYFWAAGQTVVKVRIAGITRSPTMDARASQYCSAMLLFSLLDTTSLAGLVAKRSSSAI